MTNLLTTLKMTRRLLTTLVGVVVLTGSVRPYLIEEIQDQGSITIVTRNNPTTYYEDRHGSTGYEYELAKEFAEYLGVELNLLVVSNLKEAMDALKSGKAHMAAAGLTREQTAAYPVTYGPSYSSVSEQIIYRRSNHRPESLQDLQNGRLMVTARSRHASTLRRWQREELPSLSWRESSELEASDLLQMVSDGELDYTLVNSNEFQLMRAYLPNLDVAFTLGELQSVAWALPDRADTTLKEKAFDFFYRPETGALMAELAERFYGHVEQFDYVGAHRFLRQKRRSLPKYQNFFETSAATFGFD